VKALMLAFFEDEKYKRFRPLTFTRPLYMLKIGGLYFFEHFIRQLNMNRTLLILRPELEKLCYWKVNVVRRLGCIVNKVPDGKLFLLVNARMVPTGDAVNFLQEILSEEKEEDRAWLLGRDVLAMRLKRNTLAGYMKDLQKPSGEVFRRLLAECSKTKVSRRLPLFHDFRDLKQKVVEGILSFSNSPRNTLESALIWGNEENVFVSEKARIEEEVFLDTRSGPIIIEPKAVIKAYSVIRGPAIVGEETQVLEKSIIDGSIVGERSIIGGTIENSFLLGKNIIEDRSLLRSTIIGEYAYVGSGAFLEEEVVLGDYACILPYTRIYENIRIGPLSLVSGFVDKHIPVMKFYSHDEGIVAMSEEEAERLLRSLLYNHFGRLPSSFEIELLKFLAVASR